MDEISPFRFYIRKSKTRKKYGPTDLTVNYLKELWEMQGGRCVYSNLQLTLNQQYRNLSAHGVNDPRFTASLDRIDSSLGYVVGNVQFVSTSLNWAKGTMSDEQFREFITLLRAS